VLVLSEIDELVAKAEALGRELSIKYHGCSQMTLKALQEVLKLNDGKVFKASSALAGGVARSGEVCGALLGAVMAVSLVFGRDKLESTEVSEGYKKAMEIACKVFDEFKREFGSVRCHDIQMKLFGRVYNLRNLKEVEEFMESGARDKCAEVVGKAVRIAAKAILEEGYRVTGI